MRWETTISTGTFALIGTLVALGPGCANLVGADFDRTIGGGGSAGAGITSSGITSSGITGSGGSSPMTTTGGTTSTGTGQITDVLDDCSGTMGSPSVKIFVFAAPAPPGSMTPGAKNFVTTRHSNPQLGADFKMDSIAEFFLYASKSTLPSATMLYDCVTQDAAKSHFISQAASAACECLGYSVNSPQVQSSFAQLALLQGAATATSLMVPGAMNTCATYSKNGVCSPTDYFSPLQ